MSTDSLLKYALNYQLVGKTFLRYQRAQDLRKLKGRSKPDSPLNSPLLGTARMKELMSRHYLEGRYVGGVKKVAWVTSGAPIEILRALGFFLVYPENHAALCGARRKAEGLAVHAENAGYSRDLCSYARTDIGAALSGDTPVGKLPKPDVLVCCTNICQTVLYWYRVLAEHFKVPLYVIDTPFLYEAATPHQVDFVRRQIEELIPLAEEISGKRLSFAKLSDIVHRSRLCSELWLQVMDRAQNRPAPMTAFDGFVNMGPIVDLRGDQETIEFYEDLLQELDKRVAAGLGAIKNERKRVLWDNLPIWFKIGGLSNQLAAKGVNVVASTDTYAWGELAPMMDETRPFESMARVYLHAILNRSTGDKLRTMQKMIADFSIDGVILHSDRSCKPYSLGQQVIRQELTRRTGKPGLVIEADMVDSRHYDTQRVPSQIATFLEVLA